MIVSSALLADLKVQLTAIKADLERQANDPYSDWGASLQRQHREAIKHDRTGLGWVEWSRNEVDQAAVAWILSTTFIRFCEDNDLLAGATRDGRPVPVGWIAGPGDRTDRAMENQQAYFRAEPTKNRRHWLQEAFAVLAAQPAGAALVDRRHNPVWHAPISQEAAFALIDFWRRTDTAGNLVHDFTDRGLRTRFLGDLYQDLSDHAQDTYALKQTPEFIEEFILDRTLTPAMREVALAELKLIDPACGSGHFLLGAFGRLNEAWAREAPGLDAKDRVRRAMGALHGVDLNPFAVAIARFRLTVAGMLAQGERSLVGLDAMGFRLAIGDSLLGEQGGAPEAQSLFDGDSRTASYQYDAEDLSEYLGILAPGQYHVVVGNPPYITVKDRVLNKEYRRAYKTAHRQYQLTVPFMELLFRLAIKGQPGRSAGHVGQITGNGFMKREFGKKLIEDLFGGMDYGLRLENPVDLIHVIDMSGVRVPGHGTPTVILIGRRREPVSDTVHAVLAVRGEQGQRADPANGPVWSEIRDHADDAKHDGTYVTVTDLPRAALTKHPWSLSGGGSGDVFAKINEVCVENLGRRMVAAGRYIHSGSDDLYFAPNNTWCRYRVAPESVRPLIEGGAVRDWDIAGRTETLFPYCEKRDEEGNLGFPPSLEDEGLARLLWVGRTLLAERREPGGTHEEIGLTWYEFSRWHPERYSVPLGIAFAFVATHNHFVLDRGGKVFKQSAPVIKLPEDAVEDQYLELLGLLNSSTACFWLKQVSHNKGGQGVNEGFKSQEWERFYEFTSTKLQDFPLPAMLPLKCGRTLDSLARRLAEASPSSVIGEWLARDDNPHDLRTELKNASDNWSAIRQLMVFEQEELDWEVYRLYGLVEDDLTADGLGMPEDVRSLDLGERAFEFALAHTGETAWFERHASTPITEIPDRWPLQYQKLVRRRLDLIESDRTIGLLEKPEFKRRWSTTPWDEQREEALIGAILDRLEVPELWRDGDGQPVTRSVGELVDLLAGDAVLHELARALTGENAPDLTKVLGALAPDAAVPFLAAYRYKPSGLAKFREWQKVWELQRREDAGETVDIQVPPRYKTEDFRPGVWAHRGKLDVPKERFIAYPGVGRRGESTPVLGWVGWDHRDQAFALGGELSRQAELGAGNNVLEPLVAGLVELEPWLWQWHAEVDPVYNASPADLVSSLIDEELVRLGTTRDQVTAWTPPATRRGRTARNRTKES